MLFLIRIESLTISKEPPTNQLNLHSETYLFFFHFNFYSFPGIFPARDIRSIPKYGNNTLSDIIIVMRFSGAHRGAKAGSRRARKGANRGREEGVGAAGGGEKGEGKEGEGAKRGNGEGETETD